jgi:hypothetical protein
MADHVPDSRSSRTRDHENRCRKTTYSGAWTKNVVEKNVHGKRTERPIAHLTHSNRGLLAKSAVPAANASAVINRQTSTTGRAS